MRDDEINVMTANGDNIMTESENKYQDDNSYKYNDNRQGDQMVISLPLFITYQTQLCLISFTV